MKFRASKTGLSPHLSVVFLLPGPWQFTLLVSVVSYVAFVLSLHVSSCFFLRCFG